MARDPAVRAITRFFDSYALICWVAEYWLVKTKFDAHTLGEVFYLYMSVAVKFQQKIKCFPFVVMNQQTRQFIKYFWSRPDVTAMVIIIGARIPQSKIISSMVSLKQWLMSTLDAQSPTKWACLATICQLTTSAYSGWTDTVTLVCLILKYVLYIYIYIIT